VACWASEGQALLRHPVLIVHEPRVEESRGENLHSSGGENGWYVQIVKYEAWGGGLGMGVGIGHRGGYLMEKEHLRTTKNMRKACSL